MYLLFRSSSVGGAPNTLRLITCSGRQPGVTGSADGAAQRSGSGVAALFLLLAVIGWLAARVARRSNAPAPPAQPAAARPGWRACRPT